MWQSQSHAPVHPARNILRCWHWALASPSSHTSINTFNKSAGAWRPEANLWLQLFAERYDFFTSAGSENITCLMNTPKKESQQWLLWIFTKLFKFHFVLVIIFISGQRGTVNSNNPLVYETSRRHVVKYPFSLLPPPPPKKKIPFARLGLPFAELDYTANILSMMNPSPKSWEISCGVVSTRGVVRGGQGAHVSPGAKFVGI